MSVRGEEREESTAAAGGASSPAAAQRRFGAKFAELAEQDMSRLAALCQQAGLEQLFRTALKLGGQ